MSDNSWITRIVQEWNELNERLSKLEVFLDTSKFQELGSLHQQLLEQQFSIMTSYSITLAIRIRLAHASLVSQAESEPATSE